MTDSWDSPDPQLTRLRGLVAGVERELAAIETGQVEPLPVPLRSAWSQLVKALALGSEPELRACPACARAIISEASRCRYCWNRSDAA